MPFEIEETPETDLNIIEDIGGDSLTLEDIATMLEEDAIVIPGDWIISEDGLITEPPNGTNMNGTAPPVSRVGISHVWVGNNPNNDNANPLVSNNDWIREYTSTSYANASATVRVDLPATGYSHVRVRVVRIGYINSANERLDGVAPVRSQHIEYINANGTPTPVGGVVQGFVTDFIFAIPQGRTTSNARFHYWWWSTHPSVEREANLNITWKAITPAPLPPLDFVEYYPIDEVIHIMDSGKQKQISLGNDTSFFNIAPGFYTLQSFIDTIPTGGSSRVYVRYAATSNQPASNSVFLQLHGRNPNTPTAVFYQNGALYNLTSSMVFRFNGGVWYSTSHSAVSISSFMSSTSTTLLEIRFMPTASMSSSAIRQIILPRL